MGPDCTSICSMAVAKHIGGTLVRVPPNKNVIEHKTPKQEAQERYLPLKAGRLTSADAIP
jgi:hypothetical protein